MRFVRWGLAAGLTFALLFLCACGGSSVIDGTTAAPSVAETDTAEVDTSAAASQTTEETTTAEKTVRTGFTVEDLQRENALTNLVSAYGHVRVRGYRNGELSGETNYFWHNGEVVSAQMYMFEGEPYYSGSIGNIYFEQSGGHLQGSYSLFSSDELLTETDVSSMLLTGEITDLTDKGDRWSFRILPERTDLYEKTVCQCVAEKETLALDEVILTLEDGDVIRHTIEHSPSLELNDFGLLDGLEKPYRTVRICTQLHDEAGREKFDSVTRSVPYNLELIPTLDREVQLYSNETLTKSYVYPGNGKDYTVWVTDAMG